jgi:hypothetical protein
MSFNFMAQTCDPTRGLICWLATPSAGRIELRFPVTIIASGERFNSETSHVSRFGPQNGVLARM